MATKTLYVGNLPYSATETSIATHFKNFGGTNVRIIEGRGFGFVDVDSDNTALGVVVHDDSLGDLAAIDTRPLGKLDVERIGVGVVFELHDWPAEVHYLWYGRTVVNPGNMR